MLELDALRENLLSSAHSLQQFCKQADFKPGEVIRRKGQHYRDMYVLTDGCVEVDLEGQAHGRKIEISGVGFPIGEISFLRGCAATATVTARSATSALIVDDATLARLECEQPAMATHLLRQLAETAEERTSQNLTWESLGRSHVQRSTIEIYLCRTEDMLESAKRLRYAVYCQELGRRSPYADHDNKIISDPLDETAQIFIAREGDETTGTLRGNAAAEGSLGILEELYGMRSSPHHPQATCVCTKFIVKKSKRGGPAAMKLIAAMVRFGIRHQLKECYIDCIPALLPYYKAIGFKITGPRFFHRENGPSYPMKLDLVKHGERLSRESGMRQYLNLIMKAQAIRLFDRMRGRRATAFER